MSRLNNTQSLLKEKNLDAFFLTDMSNIRYVSNFVGSIAYCLITQDKGYIIADRRYFEQAKEQCAEFEVLEFNKIFKPFITVINQICTDNGIRRLGFEKNKLSYTDYIKLAVSLNVTLEPVESFIEEFRYIKDDNEIELLKTASSIADKAYTDILSYIKTGVTEKDIMRELQISMLRHGADGPSFDIIVAAGDHSSVAHAVPGDRIIQDGDFVLMDFGALFNGYRSDMTRTVVVGHASEKQREIYKLVYDANMYAESKIKNNLPGIDAQKFSEEIVKNSEYFEYLSKGLGHGVGLDIHENPLMNYNCTHILKTNCVITVEPHIDITGFGGVRIEDTVLVTDSGCEILTKSEKKLLIL